MKSALYLFHNRKWTMHENNNLQEPEAAQLVIGFGDRHLVEEPSLFSSLKERFPAAEIITCSTAGEIYNTEVFDDAVSVVAIQFAGTPIVTRSVQIEDYDNSYDAGLGLLEKFDKENLTSLLILSDGSKVNGSDLANALYNPQHKEILITGGLAGDGSNFQSTVVGLNAPATQGVIAGIGFYGDRIRVNHGSRGGWEMFGLEKTVTRSSSNVLYEIDHKNALEVYKKYLGAEAESLPGSALLFPLAVTLPGTGEEVVRTILSIDQEQGSMTFAGNIPEGAQVRFMKANFDKITNAASDAALQSLGADGQHPQLALLISCVGRKLILQSRTDEEVEAVDEVFNHRTLLTGFYSYGELSPVAAGGQCQLHNQTMTITTFHESE